MDILKGEIFMKKMTFILLSLILMFVVITAGASASGTGKIYVDLEEVVSDTAPQIINDRTMVPVRAIAEMIGYDVYWHGEKEQVDVCEKGSTEPVIIMQINSTKAYCSKYSEELDDYVLKETELDSPATIINSRTLVPLRFISESVGYVVEYIEETRDIHLFSPEYIENHQGEGKGEEPEGVLADGKGEVVSLSMEEMTYVLEQTASTWLEMSTDEKAGLVSLICRWWEDYENIIVEDYDDMVDIIDYQMEQYYKNGTDENLFIAVCAIYDVDKSIYVAE